VNGKDISNLKRQITRGSIRGVEKEMHYLQACNCHFDCESILGMMRESSRYFLLAAGVRVGEFVHDCSSSRPSKALGLAWKLSGATQPWRDE
jgi:hypothetical protein